MNSSDAMLNPAQLRAVEHGAGPLLVVAGPGSGKTRVLTHRIARLIAEGVPAPCILAITFTNKAADEMLKRTRDLLGPDRDPFDTPQISTFHSFCARLLRREIHRLPPYRSDFTIYDREDQRSAIEAAIDARQLDRTTYAPPDCLARISRQKNEMVAPEEAATRAHTNREREHAALFGDYVRCLRERNAVDFDDLLLLAHRVLAECPEALAFRRRLHRYLLIDEFQDTNVPQYLIARLLAAEHRNICLTGDPDQSIYSWRGASPKNVERFIADFPEHTAIFLDENYRSTPQILAAAARLTGTAVGPRALFTRNPSGDPVLVVKAQGEKEEAHEAARRVEAWHAADTPLGEIAVLYRTNAQSRNLEEALVHAQIPYTVLGGVAFYQRKEVRDVLAYLRAAVSLRDDAALRRALHTPPRGIGAATVARLEESARKHSLSLAELNGRPAAWENIATRARNSLLAFGALLERLRALQGLALQRQIEVVIAETDYEAYLQRNEPETWRDRMDVLRELMTAAAETEEFIEAARAGARHRRDRGEEREDAEANGLDPLTVFLERAALVSDVDAWKERPDRIVLMTLHSAKGLEFDRVIIAGVEDGLLPHSFSGEPRDEEEERRLLYVGLTRARKSAVLFHCAWRRRFRESEPRRPSPFLRELRGEGVAEEVLEDSASVYRGRRRDGDGSEGSAARRAGDAFGEHDDELTPGVRLDHDLLGAGVIKAVSGHGAARRILVQFEEHGEKLLIADAAPFRIIGSEGGDEGEGARRRKRSRAAGPDAEAEW